MKPYINLAISIFLIASYVYNNVLEFLFGIGVSLPFSWLIIYLIFRAEKSRSGDDKLSLGKQLSFFTTTVFTTIRILGIILAASGPFLFKNTLSLQTYFDASSSGEVQIMALLYIILNTLITELLFISIIFDFVKIFSKKEVYHSSYNPTWKSNIAHIAMIIPFLIIFTIIMGIAIPIALERFGLF